MQEVVLALLDLHDDQKCKQKVTELATSVAGIDSFSINTNEKKMTIVGNMDLVEVVNKLRKTYQTEIITVGPAKEPEEPKEKLK